MKRKKIILCFGMAFLFLLQAPLATADLKEIREAGVIRHLGVPYANFVTGDGDGLDVEIIQRYAQTLGVKYEYVSTSWARVIADLSGVNVLPRGDSVEIAGPAPVRGDIIGNGLTVLKWRSQVIDFSSPYFPTAIWVIARDDSGLKPLQPTGDTAKDIEVTRLILAGKEVLGIPSTCVDPQLYGLKDVKPLYKEGLNLNDLAAVIVKGEAHVAILDVPDALVALEKYPGKLKVLGTITDKQEMAFGISKTSPELLNSFNAFLRRLSVDGSLTKLILKYYPRLPHYFPGVLAGK